jgi:hypothetical protein
MWYSICYGLIFNMILFKFTLKLIQIDSMQAQMIFNWLLFNYQHNSIQNYIFNEFWYSPAHMCLTFLYSLTKSDLNSPKDMTLTFLYEMIFVLHCYVWNIYRTPAGYTADRKTRRKRDMSCYGLLSAASHPPLPPPPLPTSPVCRTACGHVIRIRGLRESPRPLPPPHRIMNRFWQPRPKSRMASILETVSMVAEFGQQRWSCTNF